MRSRAQGEERPGQRTRWLLAVVIALVAAAAVASSLDKEPIRRVIKAHAGELRRCYERDLQDHPSEGKLVVKFHVTAAGVVDEASVQSSTLGSPLLETCVVDAVKTWRFPSGVKGGFTIVYPFIFKRT